MKTETTDCLVYVDPSPRGDWALALAALLPGREKRSFHLLATEEDTAARPDLLENAALRLSGARALRRVVRPGPPRRAVLAEAEERPYGLVIVPPAGRNALQRMLRGSRVATVVRGVHAPVLVARRPPSRFDRILAAVSGGEASEAVVAAAAALAAEANGHVDYLHAAQAALARAGSLGALVVREGLVVDEVLDAFEAGAYDLLVVGASSQVAHPRLGGENVTQRIVLGCPGSTLVVPAGGSSSLTVRRAPT